MKEEVKEEYDSQEDTKQGIIMLPMEDSDDDLPLAKRKKPAVKRKVESGDESEDEPLSKKKAKGAFKVEPRIRFDIGHQPQGVTTSAIGHFQRHGFVFAFGKFDQTVLMVA